MVFFFLACALHLISGTTNQCRELPVIRPIASLMVMLAFAPMAAEARVHHVITQQMLELPDAEPFEDFVAQAVAIDGDFLIVIVDRDGARQALMYRRGGDGQWAYARLLVQSSAPAAQLRASVVMKNSLAAIDIAGVTTIWQRTGNSWAQGSTDGEIRQPGGHAISGNSILIGATGCSEDGVIYEKSTDGVWRITGRLPSRAGVCSNRERDVELNYNYALINDPAGSVHAWARNGTNPLWRTAGDFELQGWSAGRGGALALQNTVAVAPGSTVYRRSGGASWLPAGRVIPIDYALGFGDAQRVWYRDSMLLTVESNGDGSARPHVYVLDATGQFEHVAVLLPYGDVLDLDISRDTVVTLNVNEGGWPSVTTFELHSPRVPPPAIANDFNARDVSGFETSAGSGFAIAGNQYDYIYRQSNASVDTRAVLTNSNWSRFQAVRLRMRPTAFNGPGSAAGVALRYVDENNYLALLVDADSARVESRRNGVTTVLNERAISPINGWRSVRFDTHDEFIGVFVDDTEVHWTWDREAMPAQGRVALITRHARADFDDLHASPTEGRAVLEKRYDGWEDNTRPIDKVGGTWVEPPPNVWDSGLKQTSTSGLAFALSSGPRIDDVIVYTTAQFDSWGGSINPAPWFGLVARYTDANNYYYLSIRGTNQAQIRKVVNGVTTVLDAASYTVPAGQSRDYQLRVEGNQLHAFVNGQHLLWAVDSELTEGRYGIATYRTAATFRTISASQR
jgi:hypothetical protein